MHNDTPARSARLTAGRLAVLAAFLIGAAALVFGAPAEDTLAKGTRPTAVTFRYHDFGAGSPATVALTTSQSLNKSSVVDGEEFTVTAPSGGMGTSVGFTINGYLIKVHTSCSAPIAVGYVFDDDIEKPAPDAVSIEAYGAGRGKPAAVEITDMVPITACTEGTTVVSCPSGSSALTVSGVSSGHYSQGSFSVDVTFGGKKNKTQVSFSNASQGVTALLVSGKDGTASHQFSPPRSSGSGFEALKGKDITSTTFCFQPPAPTPTPSPTPSPTPTLCPCPTPTPSPTPTPPPTPTPTPTCPGGQHTPDPNGGCPTPTPTLCPCPTPTPPPTPSPTPAATPTPTPTPNDRTCRDSHTSLDMLELHSSSLASLSVNGGGQFTDGTLTVNIAGYTGSSFAWTSNIGVDSVFARTAGGGQGFDYSPESTGDQVDAGGAITSISFCYDFTPQKTPKVTPPPTDISFGDASGGGLSGLTLALLLIVGAAATMVVGANRRTALALPAGRRSGSAIWSTQQPPRTRQR